MTRDPLFSFSVLKVLGGAVLATALGLSQPVAADQADDDLEHIRGLINQTLETEKSGIEIGWSNPETGHSGTLEVERTVYRDEQPCREYARTVERPGASTLVTHGIGCRVGRAQWELDEKTTTAKPLSPEPADATAKRPEAPKKPAAETADASACPEPAELAGAGPDEPEAAPFVAFTLPARSVF